MATFQTPAISISRISRIARSGVSGPFLTILGCFSLLLLASLPVLLSFFLWVMADRSSFLNLDYLYEKHYVLGVTACYSYGLLPVFIQHVLFAIFGRGYKPMLGCTIVAMVMMAAFWTMLLRHLPRGRRWLIAIAALTPILLTVNPNLAYSIVDLSMLFALWFVLEGKLATALAVSVVGCFGVPSLPIVLSHLIAGCIVLEWLLDGGRQPAHLLRRLLPGVLTYALLATGLGWFFGFPAMLATALPTNGIKFYHSTGWYGITRSMVFFHPEGYSLKYYLAYYAISPVTWFIFALLLLAVVCVRSLPAIVVERRLHPAKLCIALSFVVIVVFLLVAFGGRGQQEIYQPILAAGCLVAIASLHPRLRTASLAVFIVLGVTGEIGQLYKTWTAWKTTRPDALCYGLYVDPQFAKEFAQVVEMSRAHKLFLFTYGTGQHFYYPTIESPDVWFVQPGLMFPSDRQRILQQLDTADIVVVGLQHFHFFQDYDPDIRPRLAAMCLVSVTDNFRIFRRPGVEPGPCTVNGVAPE